MGDTGPSIVERFHSKSQVEKEHAIRQTVQEYVLESLSHTDFFECCSFTGGTALRIFHNLDRFSEDLDFVLTKDDVKFDLNHYVNELEKGLSKYGIEFNVKLVEKSNVNTILSCMISANMKKLASFFQLDEPFINDIYDSQLSKVKLEVDSRYSPFSISEIMKATYPASYSVSILDMPSLFAGKMHAILCRGWKNRVKGRDLYDFVFYRKNNISINCEYLKSKLLLSGFNDDELSADAIKELLLAKFDNIDYKSAKQDIVRFIAYDDVKKLEVWSPEYFISLCDGLRFE